MYTADLLYIPGTNVPLIGTEHWSFFNLLCTVFGLLAFTICLIGAIRRKRRLDEAEGYDLGYKRINGEWIDADGEVVDESEEGQRHIRKAALFISGVAAVVMAAIFIITQDMSLPMSLFDYWSPFFIIILAATIVAGILAYKRVRVADDKELLEGAV